MNDAIHALERLPDNLNWTNPSRTGVGLGGDPFHGREIRFSTGSLDFGGRGGIVTYTLSDEDVARHLQLGLSTYGSNFPGDQTGGWWHEPLPWTTAIEAALGMLPYSVPQPVMYRPPLYRKSTTAWLWALRFRLLDIVDHTPPAGSADIGDLEGANPPALGPDALTIAGAVTGGLGLTHQEFARIAGIGYTTQFYWSRTGAQPRASTMGKLLRVHSLARALIDHLGSQEAAAWMRGGDPSPLEQLAAGNTEDVEQAVASLVFSNVGAQRPPRAAFAPEPDFEVSTPPRGTPMRGSAKRVQRGILRER